MFLNHTSEYACSLLIDMFKRLRIKFKEPKMLGTFYYCNHNIKKVVSEEELIHTHINNTHRYYFYYTDKNIADTLSVIIQLDKFTANQMILFNNYYLGFFELKSIKYITTKMKLSTPIAKKKRTSVEYNGTELTLALLLVSPAITSRETIIQKVEELKQCGDSNETLAEDMKQIKIHKSDIDGYLQDIMKPEKILIYKKFIDNYHSCISTHSPFNFTQQDIQNIFISGKKNKHVEISELNNGVHKLQQKSDIYVKLRDNRFVGISVKQSNHATKSNYSVQKILGKENDKLLTYIKKEYLQSCGFDKLDKSKRHEMNKLFYRSASFNPYWAKLRELIAENKNVIIDKLVSALYCNNVPYDMYEFNGTSVIKVNDINNNFTAVTFDEHEPYYYDNSGNERNAAKLFYKLYANGCTYRVEIRWKGDIYNSSPQFQIHETP